MGQKIALSELEDIISKTHFANDGDDHERIYWIFFKERFPNCETFWRYFVIPFTKRIDQEIKNPIERIMPREGISEDIKDVASFHYSMFLNLVSSYNHLQDFRFSSFEDFYTHLASACDLAEDFLFKIYLLILECSGGHKSQILQELKIDDFLKLATTWYEKNYLKAYENYLKKGKQAPLRLPARKNVLDEYFENSEFWKEYKRYTQKIKEYRNTIVHDAQIGRVLSPGGVLLVPKKEKIQNYKKWSYVFKAQEDIKKIKEDFINMKEQMILDIGGLEVILNNLWIKPIEDLKKLFFEEKNRTLLEKYNIDLI